MDNKIIDVLRKETSLMTKDIAIKISLKKAKDVLRTLKDDVLIKKKTNNNLLWSLKCKQTNISSDELSEGSDVKNKKNSIRINQRIYFQRFITDFKISGWSFSVNERNVCKLYGWDYFPEKRN